MGAPFEVRAMGKSRSFTGFQEENAEGLATTTGGEPGGHGA